MKKIILAAAYLIMGSGMLIAQDQQQNRQRIHQQDHIIFQDGKMIQTKAGAKMEMQNSFTFRNGTIAYPDGSYKLKNGKTKMLRNGECINQDGVRFRSQTKMMNRANRATRMNKGKATRKKTNRSTGKSGGQGNGGGRN